MQAEPPRSDPTAPPRRARNYDHKVALVLQGGGALGSYQAGVFQALSQSEYTPDWVAAISIGAINGAIIAGNAPERRVEKLRAFWDEITSPSALWPAANFDSDTGRRISALHALFLGQPGFFRPRPPVNWLMGHSPVSYYDTAPLRATLERLVDFDRINAREMRFSIASVNVRSGDLTWFDNAQMTIGVEHVMASGALPPGFPPVPVGEDLFWDGGLLTNTPLQYVVESSPDYSHLIFQVDLFRAAGPAPADIDETAEREKDIRYASRTRTITTMQRRLHDLRRKVEALWNMLPPELKQTAAAQQLREAGCQSRMDIVDLVYRPDQPQGESKDYQFGRTTMEARWAAGVRDAEMTLQAAPWLVPAPPATGARSFDVQRPDRAP